MTSEECTLQEWITTECENNLKSSRCITPDCRPASCDLVASSTEPNLAIASLLDRTQDDLHSNNKEDWFPLFIEWFEAVKLSSNTDCHDDFDDCSTLTDASENFQHRQNPSRKNMKMGVSKQNRDFRLQQKKSKRNDSSFTSQSNNDKKRVRADYK